MISALKKAPVEFKRSIITGFVGDHVDANEVKQIRTLLAKRVIGGVILFKENIKSPKDIKQINQSFIDAFYEKSSGSTPIISIDQEGGFVQRISLANGFKNFKSAKAIASSLEGNQKDKETTEKVKKEYDEMAFILREISINLNFGPTVDLDLGCGVISDYERSFSASPEITTKCASIFIDSMLGYDITPVIKHFPGHGSATGDTHMDFTDISNIADDIKEKELEPFKQLSRKYSDKIGVMVSHLFDKNIDEKYPYSLSNNGVKKLKTNCPNTKIISDDYHMGAILKNFSMEEIVKASENLPIDYRIFSNNPKASGSFYKNRIEPIELFA